MSDKTISYETAEQATIYQFLKLVRQSNPYLVPLLKPMLEHAKPLFKEFYNLGMAHAKTPEHLVLDAPARVGGGMFSKIEQMKTQVNTLDEMLLNQGEALAQAKAQAVPNVQQALNDRLLVRSIKEQVESHIAEISVNDLFDRGWFAAMKCIQSNIDMLEAQEQSHE